MQTTRPNGIAPSTSHFRSGAKGGKVALAWQYVWDRLDHTEFKEAVPLAEEAAEKYGIKPDSVLGHLHLMATEGFLERRKKMVEVEVERPAGVFFTSSRKRTFYRIKKADS